MIGKAKGVLSSFFQSLFKLLEIALPSIQFKHTIDAIKCFKFKGYTITFFRDLLIFFKKRFLLNFLSSISLFIIPMEIDVFILFVPDLIKEVFYLTHTSIQLKLGEKNLFKMNELRMIGNRFQIIAMRD